MNFVRRISVVFVMSMCAFCWGGPVFAPSVPEISFIQKIRYNFVPDTKNCAPGVSSAVYLDMDTLRSFAGINEVADRTDITLSALYTPVFAGKAGFGPGLTYHFYSMPDISVEHDILAGLYFWWRILPSLTVSTDFCAFWKISVIYAVASDMPCAMNRSFAFDFTVSWKIPHGFSVRYSFATVSVFDYPLFCSPVFTLEAEKEFSPRIRAGISLSSLWIDMFTVSSNMSRLSADVFLKVTL